MKRWKKYASFFTVLVSLALLTGCGSSGRKWSDANEIDAYGTVERNGEKIDVCVCHDQKEVYLYYNDENHELFDTARIPTDEIYDDDKDWCLGRIILSDFNGDNNSDLQVYLSHSDMSESHIVWIWEEDVGYVYQAYDSSFYNPIVVIDPPEDTVYDFSMYEGLWQSDEENLYPDTYLQFDAEGNWQLYSDGDEIDNGYLWYETEDGLTYSHSSLGGAMDEGFVRIEGDRLNISTCGYFNYLDGRGGQWEGAGGGNWDGENR
ncbi:MAG: hypothetical protein ACI4EN_07945 [Butyrivibrio sp.]